MAPNAEEATSVLSEANFEKLVPPQASPWKYEIVYPSVVALLAVHIMAAYGLFLAVTTACWTTILYNYILLELSMLGTTVGAHRLWSHKSFKAKMPLQIILMLMQSMTGQFTVTNWVRDHRMHHRYTDTDADPHNPTRGFFFAHIGWLLVKKHQEVKNRGKFIDMSDIYANPVLRFQRKYGLAIIGFMTFVLPTVVPIYFWGETLNVAWHICMLKYAFIINKTLTVNSVGHTWGYKTYDKNIQPTNNTISEVLTLGEGYHNYHHVFPWDYRSAEFGDSKFNLSKRFIDFFAKVGWAFDLKMAPKHVIDRRVERTGDGSDFWGYKKADLY
ncbi:unnamed protein product [Leptosia nina]|uniref:Fatty acid desaturase domain-containing protein n=1 Tax=Leptosia nina TaxID=320188 RepID=A0AAV1JY41_9NEOP